jgi:hypothetical protein
MAEPADRTTLLLEIDASSPLAAHTSGLDKELNHALKAAGLPTEIAVHSVGEHELESRTFGNMLRLGAEAAPIVIYQLRIYLPPALTSLAVSKVVADLDQRIRRWRRRTGHTKLEVPIYGPDGETIIHIVEVEPADSADPPRF